MDTQTLRSYYASGSRGIPEWNLTHNQSKKKNILGKFWKSYKAELSGLASSCLAHSTGQQHFELNLQAVASIGDRIKIEDSRLRPDS
jgi:uncharacterized protein YjdB